MRYLSLFLLVGFIGMAVFGVFNTHVGGQNHQGICVAAASQGLKCPKMSNPINYLAFHLGTFRSFSSAMLNDISLSLLIVFFSIVGTFFSVLLADRASPRLAYCRLRRLNTSSLTCQSAFIDWLSLFENSPTFF